jgi:hypothetical protein
MGFQSRRFISDGGLILVRELDKRLGFGVFTEQHLTDPCREEHVAASGRSVATGASRVREVRSSGLMGTEGKR